MDDLSDKFYYLYSSDVTSRIQIKIGTLEGKRKKPTYNELLKDPHLKFCGVCQDRCSDLVVETQIFDQNEPLCMPVATEYKPFTTRWNWNEWMQIPLEFCDLPRTAQLAITIYDCAGPDKLMPVGGTTVSLFSKHGVYREGMLDLRVWPNVIADGNSPTTTPGKGYNGKVHANDQMFKLSKLAKKHRNGHIPKVDWLDRLTFRELEVINEREKRCSNYMYLTIEFQKTIVDNIHHHIVYFEQSGEEIHTFKANADLVFVPDPEISKDNLVERKHHMLARSLRSGHNDKDAKPNAAVRDILNQIVSYPPTQQLSNEEQDYLWKYRFYLSTNKKALAKFLKCVNWNQPDEVRQAEHMIKIWQPMDVEDALELLSPIFINPSVRRYSISRLQQAPDEEIFLYLLQLVQALKYENFDSIQEGYARVISGHEVFALNEENSGSCLEKKDSKESNSTITTDSILQRSSSYNQADRLASSTVSSVVEAETGIIQPSQSLPPNLMQNVCTESGNTDTLQSQLYDEEQDINDLASFLVYRACKNFTLANYFYWYLLLECEDQEGTIKQDEDARKVYLTVMRMFSQALLKGSDTMQVFRATLMKQQKFIDKLVLLIKAVSRENANRAKKTIKLKELLCDPLAFKYNFSDFESIPFPLDPEVNINGIVAEKAILFKSAMMPSKLHFKTSENEEYVAIFKLGDDLRQDQLILQMITLMDKLLNKENLDLKLTPYRVLATSTKHGFVQYIESIPVAEVLTADGSIQNYFKKYHAQENAPYGIQPDIMDNYVRSCAGYCVITYILGVGDRHLDNLLLTKDGRLFHIDFGYILGRDPKPLPPPMKLSKEMVEAMGGINSEHYQEFRKLCYTAFLHLRRHANLMLNLFSLMTDASVPDIALEPDKAVKKVQDKLMLDLGEEEAVHHMQNLIDASVAAVMAAIVEQFHKITQYMRK
ncbi:phosphatidylinositol 3-kinase catalytic subunit type 3 isoform X1 [Sitophilus oryzae]|uniref:Phosphatidylinositol 3-kinase catalytic subunit type 3 n=1 Tax=Sitophilus oryzae TaxID=7048 RepID=A0A6J2XXX4_SITOR|nr:phosphatidylinositol 3-kinase catalytic subunit type 3 isoform X1 [Sitophilus oryzae]